MISSGWLGYLGEGMFENTNTFALSVSNIDCILPLSLIR